MLIHRGTENAGVENVIRAKLRGRKCRSGMCRSDNVWRAVKTENFKILGMFARTERSKMVLNDNREQLSGVYIHYKSP